MGTLVFQATLGGAINLIGPNTASTVNFTLPSADGTSGQALSTNGSGTLAFGVLGILGGGTGLSSTPANGALDIGNGTGFTRTTLTAGSNITITNAAGAITIAASGGGSGDVVGPSSAVANSIALFNSTTGKLIKDSSASDGLIYGLTVGRGAGAVFTNTTLGASALAGSNTGGNNTVVGSQAMLLNTSGNGATAIGRNSMQSNDTGADCTAVGRNSLISNISGSNNVAIGKDSLYNNTTASDNVGVGFQALYTNTTSLNNVGIGYQALYSMTTTGVGNNNVGVGKFAGYSNTGGSSVFIGYGAGYYCTAANNIFIGLNAGATNSVNVTTGTNNVVIGNAVSLAAATNTNSLVLGDNVNGKGSSTGFISSGGGGVYQGNNSSSWSTTSDQRLKKNIADNNDGLDKINSIRVRNFEYRLPEEVDAELKPTDAIKKTGTQLGVIAQELQAVLPECVKQESTGVLSVDTDNLTWYMINAIKELKAEFDAYKASHP